MSSPPSKPQPIFPDLPRAETAVDKNGAFTQLWSLGFSYLFQALQANFKNEGILLPPLTADEIASIQAIYTPYIGGPLPPNLPGSSFTIPDISGQTVFDSTNRVPKVFIITFDSASPPNVVTAAWKTYTIT